MNGRATLSFSDDARLLWRPFAGYRELAARAGGRREALHGVLRWCLVIACFVSLSTAGRLLLDHLVLAPLGWAFAPAAQIAGVVIAARLVRARVPVAKLIELYFAGHAPWFVVLVLTAGVCLLAPAPAEVLRFGLRTGILFALVLGAMAWCALLTYAMFRSGLALARGRALLGTGIFYIGYAGTLIGYFLVTGQLLPLFGWYA